MDKTQTYQKITSYEAKIGEVKKVMLLYSGGLDSSIALKWIQDTYKAEVITLTADVGQSDNLNLIRKKALECGAKRAYVLDLKNEFAEKYVSRAIKANALYQGKYPLSTAISRYVMIKHAVSMARKEGAEACAHGSTGKGNSQIRFDVGFTTLDPEMKVIAPIREWGITRDKELEYARKHNISVPPTSKSLYSFDENLWGRGIASGILEDPSQEPPASVCKWVNTTRSAVRKPIYVRLRFESGVPTHMDGVKIPLCKLITKLNVIAGKCGVGLIDYVEDRIIGLKSRDLYECPAALTILEAHKDLEKFVSTSLTNNYKNTIDEKWSWLAYAGLWYDPLMDALNAFIDEANRFVTGEVRLRLYAGSMRVVGRSSPFALYDQKMTTYMTGQTFNHQGSAGFIELFALQTKIARQIRKRYDTM